MEDKEREEGQAPQDELSSLEVTELDDNELNDVAGGGLSGGEAFEEIGDNNNCNCSNSPCD